MAGRDSSYQVLRQLRAIFVLAPMGGMSDGQLIERFLAGGSVDAEEAFAVLVQRYGPMVLGVCRRILSGSADGDDAFQAVFLVLARRAGAIRRVESLKSWLYGVAIRTAKEARRRAARRKVREGGAMDLSQVGSVPDEGMHDLLALLDEELNRLPSRYREPLQLCELAGMSRQEAAKRLKVPEGTLSSRMARGRSLLRERLTRRGVALGSGALAALVAARPASAALSEPLAEATVRLALAFTNRGAASGVVPAAVASLAEGILTMISTAKLKLLFATITITLVGVVGLSFAWAAGPRRGAPDKPVAVVKEEVKKPGVGDKQDPGQVEVRGMVVDETGRPLPGIEVIAQAFSDRETRGITGQDGSFAIPIRQRQVDGLSLLARSAEGERRGVFRFDYNLTKAQAEVQPRIVLKKSREVVVRVADANKIPIVGAAVEAAGNFTLLAHATTGPDGSARLNIPADAKVDSIYALKPIQGFDYAEFGPISPNGQTNGGIKATELPASVSLTFEGTRTAQIKAVDRAGKPQAGVEFAPWLLQKPNRGSSLNVSSPIFKATTGANGIAVFDWLPLSETGVTFWPKSERYSQHRVEMNDTTKGPITALLTRTETIRGRVLNADGSPAQGIKLYALGNANGRETGQHRVRTSADGTYEMAINPGEEYSVSVDEKDWTARTRFHIIVDEDQPLAGIDFKLSRGTTLRGTVTVGPDRRPVPNQSIYLGEISPPLVDDPKPPDEIFFIPQRSTSTSTDAAGRYSIHVAAGIYRLVGPPRTKAVKFIVKDEAELVHDFQMPRPEKGPLTGRVVLAGTTDVGVAGARVELLSANPHGLPSTVTADGEGRFRAERGLDKTYLCAKSPDGSLGALVEIGPEDPEVVIPVARTASATGLLLDEKGLPAANQSLEWGRRVFVNEENQASILAFGPKVKTDANGRFTLPALIVGQNYDVSILRNYRNIYYAVKVSPKAPGLIDLGTVRAGDYHPGPSESAEQMSSFVKDAPGAGVVAPAIEGTDLQGRPLKLADFQGKYVLLDFWATWCGPCLGEIPNLQSIHDAYGKDDRFAILSLSVDEKIDEPRKFQEKRKLPWSQGFLGGGIHSAIPQSYGVRAIPAFVLIGPDGKIVARGMRGDEIKKEIDKVLAKKP